jgi:invasion protein IalB
MQQLVTEVVKSNFKERTKTCCFAHNAQEFAARQQHDTGPITDSQVRTHPSSAASDENVQSWPKICKNVQNKPCKM